MAARPPLTSRNLVTIRRSITAAKAAAKKSGETRFANVKVGGRRVTVARVSPNGRVRTSGAGISGSTRSVRASIGTRGQRNAKLGGVSRSG